MRVPKEYQPLAKAAKAAGWTLAITGSGHIAWTNPDGRTCFSPGTPGDKQVFYKIRRKLRALGLELA